MVVGIFVVTTLAVGFLAYQNYSLTKQLKSLSAVPNTQEVNTTTTPSPTSATNTSPTPTVTTVSSWKSANFASFFSYDYPANWHVAELWPTEPGMPIRIVIDPNPISTAPGDTLPGKIIINIFNDLAQPTMKLDEMQANFKPEYYTNFKSETLNSNHGPIYYYSGNIATEYFFGRKTEAYIFTINQSADIPENVQVIEADIMSDDKQLSEMLKHIVSSIKEI